MAGQAWRPPKNAPGTGRGRVNPLPPPPAGAAASWCSAAPGRPPTAQLRLAWLFNFFTPPYAHAAAQPPACWPHRSPQCTLEHRRRRAPVDVHVWAGGEPLALAPADEGMPETGRPNMLCRLQPLAELTLLGASPIGCRPPSPPSRRPAGRTRVPVCVCVSAIVAQTKLCRGLACFS